jgi:hypothetical protein
MPTFIFSICLIFSLVAPVAAFQYFEEGNWFDGAGEIFLSAIGWIGVLCFGPVVFGMYSEDEMKRFVVQLLIGA